MIEFSMDDVATQVLPGLALFGKFIGAGLATLSFIGVALALSMIGVAWLKGIQRQPEADEKLRTPAFIALGLTESIGLFALVVALMIVLG